MRFRRFGVLVVSSLVTPLIVTTVLAQGAKPSGAASPQEVVAVIKSATAKNDLLGVSQ